MRNLLFAAMVTLTISEIAFGEDMQRVNVVSTANDNVGAKLVYYIKEGLRNSKGVPLGDANNSLYTMSLVTIDPNRNDPNKNGISTIYSVVWTVSTLNSAIMKLEPVMLTHSVGVCGESQVKACADNLVAVTDEVASDNRKSYSK